jgi:hypothetical protein
MGEVAEWLKAPLSKSGILFKTGSWVRIPPSPPEDLVRRIPERCPSWLKEHDWKSCVLPKAVPRVRIPLSPPKDLALSTLDGLAKSRFYSLREHFEGP